MTLADFLPDYGIREIDTVEVAAPPQDAYHAARHLDVARIGWIHALFAVRTLPDRLRGRHREDEERRAIGIDDITRPGTGFLLLEDRPGREVVVGSIGKFWKTQIEFVEVPPAQFATWAEPGFGKLVWGFRIEPRPAGRSLVALELRVTGTDEAAWRRFARYWRLIGPFSHAIRRRGLALLERDLRRQTRRGGEAALPPGS